MLNFFCKESCNNATKEIEILKSTPRIIQESAGGTDTNNIKLKCNQIRNLLDDIINMLDAYYYTAKHQATKHDNRYS